jgi:hypothetical protein
MLTNHLTDDDIQQYALDGSNCEPEIIVHLQSCEACKARVATYQLLFSAIKEQPEPAFDFDFAGLVLAQLPAVKSRSSQDNILVYLFLLVTVILTGTLVYLFREYLTDLFTGITSLLLYLIATTVITILSLLCIDMYKSYQKKMNALDFY